VDAARPLAACAYEKTGGAGAASPDLELVELILKYSEGTRVKNEVLFLGAGVLLSTRSRCAGW
jgi:hypothetical protein